jgi:hypothetical protein
MKLQKYYIFRLRLFRRKTFSVVKYFQMQMIFRKMFVFPVFVCILENAPENILRCLARRKMNLKKKKPKMKRYLF